MVGREAGALWIGGELGDPSRPRITDQESEHAFSGRKRPDRSLLLRVDADSDEVGKCHSGFVQDPECAVTRTGHRTGLFDDVAQERGKLEVRLDEQRGFQKTTKFGGILDRAVGHQSLRLGEDYEGAARGTVC